MRNFKKIDKSNAPKFGVWLNSDSIIAAELAGECEFDWTVVDWEHGMCGYDGILGKVRALSATHTGSVVRVPLNSPEYMKKALDAGASGIMVPSINTPEEAATAVSFMRYAPAGIRGMASGCRASDYGLEFKAYFAEVNDSILKAVQIETAEAVDNIDAIAAVDGVDMLFLGHSDLTASLGIFGDYQNARVLEIEQKLLEACAKHNKLAGLIARGKNNVSRYIESGFTFIILGSDTGLLKNAMLDLKR